MTDHEHTPLTEVIREAYIGEPPYTLYEYTEEEFDRWLAEHDAAIEAAAEQRGAVMVMDALKREASDSSWEGIVQPGRSLQELVDHIENGIRADQIEGDDEAH